VIKILPGERFTPFALAKKLGALAVLESSSYQKGRERYSLLMVEEAFRVQQEGDTVVLHRDGKRFRVAAAQRAGGGRAPDDTSSTGGRTAARDGTANGHDRRDILDILLYFANQHPQPHQDFPFPSGGIGYLSYEFARKCDTIRFQERPDPLQTPLGIFVFGHVFVVFDHYTDLLYVIGLNYNEHEIDLEAAVARTEAAINDMNFNYLQPDEREYSGLIERVEGDRGRYLEGVKAVRDEVIAGNLLQGVLSRRLYVHSEIPAIEAYRRLRMSNPSPYLFYMDFGDFQLFGSSPEMHVKVKDDGVRIRPIAGTRRRGETRGVDLANEKDLLADPKERAEHLMLVDLARNDIGRICAPGSVDVTELMGIERYSHVMHIVSEARGELAGSRRGIDAVRATFPAGTVSGAPKIRAIETIDGLEPHPRGFYAGLVGYLEPGGNLDTAITIRSAMRKDGYLVMQAGAGVVYDSVPEKEFEETQAKLAALAAAIGVEV
jgi:anthranilate synthase component 1